MMNKFLIGTKKHGCLIDNDLQTITYYDLLSLAEKLQGRKQKQTFDYKNIENVLITYGIQDFFRAGSMTLTMVITLSDQTSYDVIFLFSNTTREDLKTFIHILRQSPLHISDPYDILNQIETSKESLWNIIANIEKERFEKRGNHSC